MRIIGSGFLARNLAGLAGGHDDTVVYAAGPSGGAATDLTGFDRDGDRLSAVVRDCLAHNRRLVYLSTSSVGLYGRQGAPLREDGPVFPCSAYGRHKLAMEAVVRAAGVEHLILRLSYPVGAHQPPHQIVPALTAQLRTGAVTVWRGARRDLFDVLALVPIIDTLLTDGVTGEIVNIASGYGIPVETVVDHLAARLGVEPERTVKELPAEDEIAVDKLRALVPDTKEFGPDHFRRVLDRYVPEAGR
jgi:nucleoside-diphosphate-sugar epimerase